jgi:hypothetical protein
LNSEFIKSDTQRHNEINVEDLLYDNRIGYTKTFKTNSGTRIYFTDELRMSYPLIFQSTGKVYTG